MTIAPKFTKTIAAAVLLSGLTIVPVSAAAPEARNITAQFASITPDIDRLQVIEVGGVVVLRGRAYDRAAAEAAARSVQRMGYSRIANLIQILEAPNDVNIQREAERELAMHRSLGGSQLSVASEKGIIFLRGSVQHELQKDIAVAVLRSVEGVREVRSELVRN
jgi:osmotically-inducible protein OsmY